MKKFFFFLLCCFSVTTFAQYKAIPSVGIGGARIGMPVQAITKLIGKPQTMVSRQAEKEAWENAGYHTDREMVFELDWDAVYGFGDNHPYAIWKIYTRHDTAVLFNMSRFGVSTNITRHIMVPGGLSFYNDTAAITRIMGNDFAKGSGTNHYNEFIYRHKGIKLIVDGNKLCNILLFKAYEPAPAALPEDCPGVLMAVNGY